MEEIDVKRQEASEIRAQRIIDFNKSYTERQQVYMERKNKLQTLNLPLLSHIEKKILNSTLRKQRMLSNKCSLNSKLSMDLEDRQQWKHNVDESVKQKALEKFVGKMSKVFIEKNQRE